MTDIRSDTAAFLREVVSAADPALPEVKDIYLESFSEEERLPAEWFDEMLSQRAVRLGAGQPVFHLLVAESGEQVRGFITAYYYHRDRRGEVANLGFFIYLAIHACHRGQGLGTRLYRSALDVLKLDAFLCDETLAAVIFDVESPELAPDEENRKLRERRIALYRRLGADYVEGAHVTYPPAREGLPELVTQPMYHAVSRCLEPEQIVRATYSLILGRD